MREPRWGVVVPVKRLAAAKTRLRATPLGVPHARLVLAMAQDTVRAVRACPVVAEVLVVTDDPEAAAALGALGARVVPDVPAAGINAAISFGAATLAGPAGRSEGWISALAADLPALRPDELAAALGAAAQARVRGFVPDHTGTGTTLLGAPPYAHLDPQFGPGSAARHAASGAWRMDGDWPSLRQDVDTAADLAAARQLGLGRQVAAVLAWRARHQA